MSNTNPDRVNAPTGTAYPTFADKEAEVIWLQGQLTESQRLLAYQSDRLRLRADLWEAHRELDLLHARESARRGERISELEREMARVIAQGGVKSGVMNHARMVLGSELRSAECGVRNDEAAELPAGVCRVRSAAEPELEAARRTVAGAVPIEKLNPFPNGRFASKERGGV